MAIAETRDAFDEKLAAMQAGYDAAGEYQLARANAVDELTAMGLVKEAARMERVKPCKGCMAVLCESRWCGTTCFVMEDLGGDWGEFGRLEGCV